jgi:hypothetical protein
LVPGEGQLEGLGLAWRSRLTLIWPAPAASEDRAQPGDQVLAGGLDLGGGVAEARQLDDDLAVLRVDVRLGDAHRVDAAAHGVEGLADRGAAVLGEALLDHLEVDDAARLVRGVDALHVRERDRQDVVLGERDLGGVRELDVEAIDADGARSRRRRSSSP